MKTIWLLVAFFNGVGECSDLSPDGDRWSHAHIYQFSTYDECSGVAEGLLSQGNDCRYIAPCEEVDRVIYGPGEEAYD